MAVPLPPKISKGISLYTSGAPNGWKANILVKELDIPCKVKPISLYEGEQKQPWYLDINPNGRIPAIVDHDNSDFTVFESGAVMMYLAEKAGQFYPSEWNKRSEVHQWLFFGNAGVGPMQGQATHFVRYAPEHIEYAANRYINETHRLYSVLEQRLATNEWLAADEYTIADMASWVWVFGAPYSGMTLEQYPNLKTWHDKILERPAVLEGINVPEPNPMMAALEDPEKMKQLVESGRTMMVSTDKVAA